MASNNGPPVDPSTEAAVEQTQRTILASLQAYGRSSMPPMILATLIFPLHARPLQPLPMLFPPVLLGTSYVNLAGYKTDAAGVSAAWSALYLLLARRRQFRLGERFGARGFIRGGAVLVAAANAVAGGVAYVTGKKGREDNWIGKESDT